MKIELLLTIVIVVTAMATFIILDSSKKMVSFNEEKITCYMPVGDSYCFNLKRGIAVPRNNLIDEGWFLKSEFSDSSLFYNKIVNQGYMGELKYDRERKDWVSSNLCFDGHTLEEMDCSKNRFNLNANNI